MMDKQEKDVLLLLNLLSDTHADREIYQGACVCVCVGGDMGGITRMEHYVKRVVIHCVYHVYNNVWRRYIRNMSPYAVLYSIV